MTGEPAVRPPGLGGRDQLAADLRSLGLRRGQDLLIHCSLRQSGRIDGGAAALLSAILDVAGPEATLRGPDPDHAEFSQLESLSRRHGRS